MLGFLYARMRYFLLLLKLFGRLIHCLRKQQTLQKTTQQSLEKYQQYNNREQIDYASREQVMFFRGRFQRMSFKEARHHYLEYLYRHIDTWLTTHPGQKMSILEVGCGNCINLVNLRQKYGEIITVLGIDISPERIAVSREHYGAVLDGVELHAYSVTSALPFSDAAFDLVFSMHCIEQIAYETRAAVCEMYRLARWRAVFIEPIFEHGNMAQKLYLIISDHCRILLRTVFEQGWAIVENEPLDIQSNPVNQSSVLVVEKSSMQHAS